MLLSLLKVEMWSKYIEIRINIVLRAIITKGAILDRALRHALWYILFFVIIILIKYYTWVEKIKTKCNVGIHGNIKSWLWVEYIASTGVRIIIIIDNNFCHCCMLRNICQNNYHCFMLRKNEKQNLLFQLFKSPLQAKTKNIDKCFSWNCYSTHSFFSPSHLKKSTDKFISSCLSCFQISFFKGQELREKTIPKCGLLVLLKLFFFLGMNLK